jgi:hypothetical protein
MTRRCGCELRAERRGLERRYFLVQACAKHEREVPPSEGAP